MKPTVNSNSFIDIMHLVNNCKWAYGCVYIIIRAAPIIDIGRLVRWYCPIVIYTVGKYKFLFLLPEVNKHESGFHFR